MDSPKRRSLTEVEVEHLLSPETTRSCVFLQFTFIPMESAVPMMLLRPASVRDLLRCLLGGEVFDSQPWRDALDGGCIIYILVCCDRRYRRRLLGRFLLWIAVRTWACRQYWACFQRPEQVHTRRALVPIHSQGRGYVPQRVAVQQLLLVGVWPSVGTVDLSRSQAVKEAAQYTALGASTFQDPGS